MGSNGLASTFSPALPAVTREAPALQSLLDWPGSANRDGDDFRIDETEGILFALAEAVEQRDRQTAGHCERLAFMSVALGVGAGLSRPDLIALYRGGYLHDVGKVGIPDSIMLKRGELSAEEWAIMRSHTLRGEEICRPMESLHPVLPLIRHHHERWDGSGYPDRLRGDQIPFSARLLQIADIYDALISPRPYKPAYPPERALEIIREETARGWRDPQIVDLFLRMHEDVICRIIEYTEQADRNMETMRASLQNLRCFLDLAQDGFTKPSAGQRTRQRRRPEKPALANAGKRNENVIASRLR